MTGKRLGLIRIANRNVQRRDMLPLNAAGVLVRLVRLPRVRQGFAASDRHTPPIPRCRWLSQAQARKSTFASPHSRQWSAKRSSSLPGVLRLRQLIASSARAINCVSQIECRLRGFSSAKNRMLVQLPP